MLDMEILRIVDLDLRSNVGNGVSIAGHPGVVSLPI